MLLTVDTGGTKTLVASFDRKGQPKNEHRFLTPRDEEEYIATLIETVHEHFPGKLDAVIIAVPGVVKNNVLVWCGNLPWAEFDIAGALSTVFDCPVWLGNDADLAGLAETRALPKIPACSLYVTISTGIGTGVILDGNLVPALSGSEGGHSLVEYDGRVREWEDFASGAAIKNTYGKYARDIHNMETWKQIADKISRGFLAILPTLQPDVVIIGGSIGTYFDLYAPTLKRLLKDHLPDHIKMPEFRQAAHPEEAVIYGCYYYGLDQLARD